MPGSACTVADGQSCMRIVCPSVRRMAACRIDAALALFQSSESTSHVTTRSPSDDATEPTVPLVSPYGGRKTVGVTPAVCWMACCVRDSCDCTCCWDCCTRCGWSQLWLPIWKPALRYACMSDALLCAFWPVGNTVAVAPYWRRVLMTWFVVPAFGPSSKVRPT